MPNFLLDASSMSADEDDQKVHYSGMGEKNDDVQNEVIN